MEKYIPCKWEAKESWSSNLISEKIDPQIKKIAIGTYISIITLNVNGLNAPTKIHRLAEWIQK